MLPLDVPPRDYAAPPKQITVGLRFAERAVSTLNVYIARSTTRIDRLSDPLNVDRERWHRDSALELRRLLAEAFDL